MTEEYDSKDKLEIYTEISTAFDALSKINRVFKVWHEGRVFHSTHSTTKEIQIYTNLTLAWLSTAMKVLEKEILDLPEPQFNMTEEELEDLDVSYSRFVDVKYKNNFSCHFCGGYATLIFLPEPGSPMAKSWMERPPRRVLICGKCTIPEKGEHICQPESENPSLENNIIKDDPFEALSQASVNVDAPGW
jgi:hypothetical protein